MSTVRDQWLEWRRGGLGASDAAAVSGFSRFGSPWSVYVDKLGLVDTDDTDNEIMEFGRRFEAVAAPWFYERTGLYIAGEQSQVTHPGEPWARSTPEGFVVESIHSTTADAVGTWEVKAPVDWTLWQPGLSPDEIGDGAHAPIDYQVQALWQQWTSGLDRTWFGVLHGRRFRIYELRQDGPDLRLVVDQCRRFWFDHVLAQVPPPIDGSEVTASVLKQLWPRQEPGTSVDVGELRDRLVEREELKYRIKEMEGRVDLIDNEVRSRLEDAEEGRIDGVRAVTYKAQIAHRIDTTRLRADHAALAEQYTYAAESRVLRYRKAS
jgi:putative phage-type endonuclease